MTGSSRQDYASRILLCLLVAICMPFYTEAGYTMNETCAYIKEGYIGDPTNCKNWGYCKGGVLLTVQPCTGDLVFDSQLSQCNTPENVQCQSTVGDVCKLAKDPGYIADPNNCNRYCYCSNGVTQCFTCPANQVFNPETIACTWSKFYSCPADSICRLVGNNVFAGDPSICGNYIRCQSGTGISTSCGDNMYFNPLTGECTKNNPCTSTPGNTPSSIPPTDSSICSNYAAGGNDIQYFADGYTCYGYYGCKKLNGIGTWGSCPFATHFNPDLQKCVTPYSFDCQYNRCGNLNSPFVAQPGCQTYWVCQNQFNTSSGNCSAINPEFGYFDEFGGGCVQQKPINQAICNATLP